MCKVKEWIVNVQGWKMDRFFRNIFQTLSFQSVSQQFNKRWRSYPQGNKPKEKINKEKRTEVIWSKKKILFQGQN